MQDNVLPEDHSAGTQPIISQVESDAAKWLRQQYEAYFSETTQWALQANLIEEEGDYQSPFSVFYRRRAGGGADAIEMAGVQLKSREDIEVAREKIMAKLKQYA